MRGPLYIILAVVVFLAPVVLTHLKNSEQNRLAEYYSEKVMQMEAQDRSTLLDQAREYNQNLPEFGSPDPWVHGVDTSTPGYRTYLDHLNVDSMMARLHIPSVGIDLPVYHGTSTSTLAHGVGHLYGTALPVGGEGTHAVLTGHTGLATLTMFDNLTHVKIGDIFTLDVVGDTLAYEVDDIRIVLPEDISSIRPIAGHDLLTLVTCTPYGINTHRLLVRGRRIDVPHHQDERRYRSPWQLWMTIAVGISLAALLYLVIFMLRRRNKADTQQMNGEL
ncbi:class C sortase [Corynebacterium sp. ES2715-CONJ3]|uniref:class C sortase n=1 Tax=Corynebacterium sp. ES2715-CONJ3 TaxID=2974028 RepID=UPI0021697D15|nr:class C sortase [Corynebacterium sp. ES2715-CONJ3]MCS4492309.1 class C sortase [Corynebacterium sp. ES2715-CONJ3]